MRPSRRLLCTSALAATLAAAPVRARADDAVTAYRDAVARASEAFDNGDYPTARAGFQAAYAIHAEPVLLFDIASTYRREGDLDRALDEYRAYLAQAPADAPERERAEQTIADLEAQLAAREIAGPGPMPPPEEEAPVEVEIDRDDLDVPPPRPSHGAGVHTSELLRWGGVALGAASLVTLGAAIADARTASAASGALEALPPGTSWDHEQAALYEHGQDAHVRAIVWSVASVALAGSGVALYLWGDRRHESLTVAPDADGAVVSYAGRF